MFVSDEFIKRVRLFPERQYKLAQKAGIHHSTLSKIVNGIDPIREGDDRVIRVGRILGLSPKQCFEMETRHFTERR